MSSGKFLFTLVLCLCCCSFQAKAQRLDLFTSETGKLKSYHGTETVPYDRIISFYDYIVPDESFDLTVKDKDYFFIYFKLPVDVTEIGVRVFSPVPNNTSGNKGDFETENYGLYLDSTKIFFDTWLALEQGFEYKERDSGSVMYSNYKWKLLRENDNSGEVMAQPSGKSRNSLVRASKVSLGAGLYRIRITDSEKGKPTGSYLLQIGILPGLKGIKVSRNINDFIE